MDLESTSPDGRDIVHSAQLNITVNNAPIDPNLVLQGVVPHLVGDKEELVLIFRPLIVGEGEDPKVTILSISGAQLDMALASSDKVTTIGTLGTPLEFAVHPGAAIFGVSSLQISIRNSARTGAPPGGNSVATTVLSKEEAQSILIIYPSPKNGELVVGSLSKKVGGNYVHTELDLKLTPDGRAPLTRIVQGEVSPGSDELMFSANSAEAFFIRRREVFAGVSALDIVTRPYASPLSDLSFEAATYDIGDFNGDGIADLYVSTNFSILTASAMLSAEDVVCAGCLIYFGDGLGGFLETSMNVLGGPSTEWSINDEIQASFGKGTKESTSAATAKPQLL